MNALDSAMLVLYAGILLLLGWQSLAMCFGNGALPRWQRVEMVGLAIALGCGGLPWLLLMLSMLGRAPHRVDLLLIGALALATLAIRRLRFDPPAARRSKIASYAMPALALLAIQAALLIGQSLLPTYEIDTVSIWGLKAKVLFFEPLRPTSDYFSNLSLSFTHLDYPLLQPMLWAGAFAMLRRVDEGASKLILLLPTLSIALMIYGFAARRVGGSIAIVLTALTIGTAATTRWAAQGMADQPLAMFIAAAALTFIRYHEAQRRGDAILLGLFAALATLTKLEGQVLLAMVGLLLLVGIIWRRSSILGLLAATICYLPWVLWARRLPHTHENYQSRLSPANITEHLSHTPAVIKAIAAQFAWLTWWPILLLLLLSLALGWRSLRRVPNFALCLILLAFGAADLLAYLVSPWDTATLVGFTLDRLLLQITPLMVLIVVVQWEAKTSIAS